MAWLVGLAPDITLAIFDLATGMPAGRGQIDGTCDGAPLPRPVLSTRLALRSGGTRCVVLVGRAATDLARCRLDFRLGERQIAFTDPDWLQSPLAVPDDLIDGLAAMAVPRLVRFLAPNVAARAAPGAASAFRATVLSLLDRLHVARGSLAAACPAGDAGLILSYRVPAVPGGIPADGTVLRADGVEVLPRLAICAEGADLLHLFLPRAESQRPVDIVLAGARPLHLGPSAQTPLRTTDLVAWLDRRPAAVRAWAEGVLGRLAGADTGTAALLAEARLHPAAGPEVARAHLAATRGGVLVWADITDPGGLVVDLQVGCAGRTASVPVPADGRLRAFAPWQPAHDPGGGAPGAGATARLRLRGRSGRTLATVALALTDPAAAPPAGLAQGDPEAAARSLARAWADRHAPDPTAEVLTCGPAAVPPRLTLLVPLTADPDLIRARAALVAGEPAGAGVEIDCLSVGRPVPALLTLLAQVARVTGVAHRVLILPDGMAPADSLVAGLRAARAPAVTLMGAAILPDGPGWLSAWSAALDRVPGGGILGGTVLHPDGSVHHAGGRLVMAPGGAAAGSARGATAGLPLVTWTGTGLPVADLLGDLGADETIRSDLFTVDAVGLTAAGRAAILAAGACLPDPDLVLLPALLRAGAGQVSLSCRFVRFGGGAAPDPVVRSASLRLIADAAGDARAIADADDPAPLTAPTPVSAPSEAA
ncbi:MAG: hypothetical protein MUF73_01135 [Rhodobacteraceae bacterium]|jgi:hypothetical protein|nr:hypothetical protein [Paracoccaceae bacterium]